MAIQVPPDARRHLATIYLRVNPSGWLTASWLVALVICASIVLGRLNFGTLFSKKAPEAASSNRFGSQWCDGVSGHAGICYLRYSCQRLTGGAHGDRHRVTT